MSEAAYWYYREHEERVQRRGDMRHGKRTRPSPCEDCDLHDCECVPSKAPPAVEPAFMRWLVKHVDV